MASAKQSDKRIPKTRTVKRPSAPNGRRSVSRVRADAASSPAPRKATGMLSGLTAAEAAAEGLRVVQVDPSALIPHPFNDPARSCVDRDNRAWTDLLDSIAANGVRIAGAAVTRSAFTERWPHLVLDDSSGDYILIYGHRRRAAAVATATATMPVIIDDTLLDAPDGGLVAMYEENQAREDLSPVAEAELLAKFIDEIHLTQRDLAAMLGLAQTTVWRRLSLLLLAAEIQAAVAHNDFSPTEAAKLAAKLPYGPARAWQKDTDADEQNSEQRRDEQLRAYHLIRTTGTLADSAADRVINERHSRAEASAKGIEIIDPVVQFGDAATAREHRIYDDIDAAGEDLVAGLDDLGLLAYYSTRPAAPAPNTDEAGGPSDNTAGDRTDSAESDGPADKSPAPRKNKKPVAAEAAKQSRREAAQRIMASPPPRTQLLQIFADQYALGVTALAGTPAAEDLAAQWGHQDGQLDDPRARLQRAWALALAGYELHTSDRPDGAWAPPQPLYYALLRSRAKYEPSSWERRQLDKVGDSS